MRVGGIGVTGDRHTVQLGSGKKMKRTDLEKAKEENILYRGGLAWSNVIEMSQKGRTEKKLLKMSIRRLWEPFVRSFRRVFGSKPDSIDLRRDRRELMCIH